VANEKAASADESYITQCRAQGFYPAAYYPHNVHFLYSSAAFEGRSGVSIEAARKLSANMTPAIVEEVPASEEFAPMELYALARFGRWQELLSAPAPPSSWRYVTGVWRYGRGMALAAQGEEDGALKELLILQSIAADLASTELVFASGSSPTRLLTIAMKVLESRIALEEERRNDAIGALREAVVMQDGLPYTEPPPWYFPTREALGHALLASGNAAEAEAVYREQLEHTPRNGWSLFGLVASLRAQGKTESAQAAEAQRAEVWSRADITLEASVY
jgi:tetratricopeptide (TPR) repeat protein